MLGRIYQAVKIRFDGVAQQLIYRSHDLYDASLRIKNPTLRAGVQVFATALADILKLLLQLPRLDAVQFRSETGSVIYVGERDNFSDYLERTLLPDGCEEIDLGRVSLWRLPSMTELWLKENQLVCCRVSRFFPWRLPGVFAFDNALHVYQVLTLDRPLDEMLAGKAMSNLRRKVNRMLKVNFEARVSHSDDDLDMFYHQMYLPMITQRHQELAVVTPYQEMKHIFDNGFLLLITYDEQIVAGSLCRYSDGIYYYQAAGVIAGDFGEVERDIYTALYWSMINHAMEMGAKEINFLASLAWVSDGVFFYKQHWGAAARPNPRVRAKLVVRANHLSDEWQKRINDIGFITWDGKAFLRVYINEPPSSVEEACELAVRNGLKGIQVVTPGERRTYV